MDDDFEANKECVNDEHTFGDDEGDRVSLVVQDLLYTPQVSISHRHSLFRTTCAVQGKLCFLIIDSGSSENIVSKKMVEKLEFPTQPHPRPYENTYSFVKDGLKVTLAPSYAKPKSSPFPPAEAPTLLVSTDVNSVFEKPNEIFVVVVFAACFF
ncbi:hypothetical protein IFM89_034786 [Coptis chinensis]|uniref:Uncharacterized protein n=1 Tax=Coptis chinensis TaxID=261450 RepID=A0A835LGL2_9MAGN|nr:hypothetical protein IFM89_034786 [Coptis chinensis]